MSFIERAFSISKSVRYQLRNPVFIRQSLTQQACEQLMHAFISSRLDFCYYILFGLTKQQQYRLQSLQNSSVRLLTFTPRMSSIRPLLRPFVNTNQDIFIPLYTTLVHPHLEYCTVPWNPCFIKADCKIEAATESNNNYSWYEFIILSWKA